MKRKSQTTFWLSEQTFWKTVKPFLSDKTPPHEKINLIQKDKIIKTESKTANILNIFFSTIISNLNIPEYPVSDPIFNYINDSILKSILKYKDHPDIKAIEKLLSWTAYWNFLMCKIGKYLMKLLI